MQQTEVLQVFEDAGALLKGHFRLSSGLHSEYYLQCARVLMDPKRAALLCSAFVKKLTEHGLNSIDKVVSPAMGGVIVGFEVARQLEVESVFTERVEGELVLRRGFVIQPGEKILMMEDVVTTGLSSRECIDAITKAGGQVIAAGALIDRSAGRVDLGVPLVSLAQIEAPTFEEDSIPAHLQNIPAIKPGSRALHS